MNKYSFYTADKFRFTSRDYSNFQYELFMNIFGTGQINYSFETRRLIILYCNTKKKKLYQ